MATKTTKITDARIEQFEKLKEQRGRSEREIG